MRIEALFVSFAMPLLAETPQAWINEFHYDNEGADVSEFVEIAVDSSFSDLASIRLSLYNGNGGTVYESHRLNTFTAGETIGGITLFHKSIAGIQNGSPDGLALEIGGALQQFISYEGVITGMGGIALGLTSTDIGLVEPIAGALSLGLAGEGNAFADFQWSALATATPGAVNIGQSIVVAPEPSVIASLCIGAIALIAARRKA